MNSLCRRNQKGKNEEDKTTIPKKSNSTDCCDKFDKKCAALVCKSSCAQSMLPDIMMDSKQKGLDSVAILG